MPKQPSSSIESDQALYPISTVVNLTGVNAVTLRAWERRYQLIEPIRKASGHRLYTQQHINQITKVLGLLDRGMRIGQVKAGLIKDDNQAQTDTNGTTDNWRTYLDNMLAATIRFEESGLDDAYNTALSLHPSHLVTEKLLTPLLTELGQRWADGQGSVAEEHFFGFYLRNKLGARFHHRFKAASGPKLLMACLPGEQHVTGLLLAALTANEVGYQTILLGSDMPLEELPAVTAKTNSQGIILSAFLMPSPSIMEKGLAKLVSKTNVPVFLGGNASISSADALEKIGIHALGTDLILGIKRIRELVPLRDQTSN